MDFFLRKFDFVDLFAGVGGFHHALGSPEFGGRCVLSVDIDPECRAVISSTWPELQEEERLISDIRSLTLDPEGEPRTSVEIARLVPDHDVLCAGFPCQPFSKSGAQIGVLDQTRGTLFFDIAKIVEAKRPKFLMLENVRNLAGPRHTHTWNVIVQTLRSLGYRVSDDPVVFTPHFLPPELNGRPQSRDRVFILATRVDVRLEEGLQHGLLTEPPLIRRSPVGEWNPQAWNVEDFLLDEGDPTVDFTPYRLRVEEVAWLNAWNAFIEGIPDNDLPGFPIWVDAFQVRPNIPAGTPKWKADFLRKNSEFYSKHRQFINAWRKESWLDGREYRVRDFPASRRKFEWQARSAQPKRRDRDIWKLTIHFRPSGIRVKPATYLPALVAITQTSIIGSRRRRITPTEAARLQGLPDWVFSRAGVDDATAYKQAGNAVNVGVVQYVAAHLFAAGGEEWGREVYELVQRVGGSVMEEASTPKGNDEGEAA